MINGWLGLNSTGRINWSIVRNATLSIGYLFSDDTDTPYLDFIHKKQIITPSVLSFYLPSPGPQSRYHPQRAGFDSVTMKLSRSTKIWILLVVDIAFFLTELIVGTSSNVHDGARTSS